MNFTNLKTVTIPEGNVSKILSGNHVLWSGNAFPSIYQKVEYIQAANGVGAYINLGFSFDKAAEIEIGVYYDTSQTSGQIFGAAENSGKLRCMITAPYSNGVAAFYGSTGTAYVERTFQLREGNNDFKSTWKKGELTVYNKQYGSTLTTTTQGEFTMSSDLLLFAQNYNSTPRYAGLRRVYYFRYYNKDNTLICDMIPCYRKSDGVIGMYDVVRKQFFTNVGAGSFTKGADTV